MQAEWISCGPFASKSEKTALHRIRSGLASAPGNESWRLLTNIQFGGDRRQPVEIDLIAIGPPGVRLVEVKHWGAQWIGKRRGLLGREADKLTAKAKRVGTRLRKVLPEVGWVDGCILLTTPPGRVAHVTGRPVRGVGVHSLADWAGTVGLGRRRVLTDAQVVDLGQHLARDAGIPARSETALARYSGLEEIVPNGGGDFHRVYRGLLDGSRERVVIHLYDLSAGERNAAVRAEREWEALRRLDKRPWAPSIVESFQPVPNHDGELYYFSIADSDATPLRDKADDRAWAPAARVAFCRQAARAVREMHDGTAAGEALIHRNLTMDSIRVREDGDLLVTGLHWVHLPSRPTLAKTPSEISGWDEATAPEVRRAGDLSAAGQAADTYALCYCLHRLFADADGATSRLVRQALDKGLAADPGERIGLQDLERRLDQVGGRRPPRLTPRADLWAEGQEVPFRGNAYRILERLGRGGVGITFRVEKLPRRAGAAARRYVAKAVTEPGPGRKVLRAYDLARPHLQMPLATVFEVADRWRPDSFVALMQWVPGQPLHACREMLRAEAPAGDSLARQARVLNLLQGACRALDKLHRSGLAHGDVSPGNLIVSGDRIVLTDYDCVTRIGETQQWQGTIEYGAPVGGGRALASASNDLYALGASFFHAVFDELPFRRRGDLSKDRGLRWSEANRNAYPAVADVLDKATHPDPDRRFQSAADALDMLAAMQRSAERLASLAPSAEWSQAIDEADESVRSKMLDLARLGSPPPDEVGFELTDHKGAVVAEAELAWHRPKAALLREDQKRQAKRFEAEGWSVFRHDAPAQRAHDLVAGAPSEAATGAAVPAGPVPATEDFYGQARRELVDWLRDQLIGPAGHHEKLPAYPLTRFPVGMLSPVEPGVSGIDPGAPGGGLTDEDEVEVEEAEADPNAEVDSDTKEARPVRRKFYTPPSSVGFSFFVQGEPSLQFTATAVYYAAGDDRGVGGRFEKAVYTRNPIWTSLLWEPDKGSAQTTESGRMAIEIDSRRFRDGFIVTATLCNRQEVGDGAGLGPPRDRVDKTLFEASLECAIQAGQLTEFPRVDSSLLTDEEQELELQYRDRSIFAVGHGGAVDWEIGPDGKGRIWTDFLPSVEVPQMSTSLRDGPSRALGMRFLAATPIETTAAELAEFVEGYEQWVSQHGLDTVGPSDRPPTERILRRMHVAVHRMKAGVELLKSDQLAATAFRIANQAMLDQMMQADRVRGKPSPTEKYRWRPFQLAFLLTVVESVVHENSDFREVVDLIWFPTGGGKTEAYLLLGAFLIAWRRMRHPGQAGGTTILMRYTLRLLTRQQFERAARMTFALERIRRRHTRLLGSQPITVGMWVGLSTSPNSVRAGSERLQQIADGAAPPNGLVLGECPWCGAEFSAENYRCDPVSFEFRCLSSNCEFGQSRAPLPCDVIDETLYESPPTLLVATIDKFARLAWEERAAAFFGGTANRPPELIIQDEVHLVTGPLGSVAGLYEAALETVISLRGVRPKYVASTATIRNASEQVRRLYGRQVAVFPPPGPTCDDSYFARTDRERPSRLYVGYLAPHLVQRTCLAPLAGSLLCGPREVFRERSPDDRETLADAWSTQVIYHTTLRAVGDSHNLYSVDVRDWTDMLRREAEEARMEDQSESGDPPSDLTAEREVADDDQHQATTEEAQGETAHEARLPEIAQLTSIPSARKNAETFQRLEKFHGEEGHIDVLLATNMLSVGVDVARLALMVVHGQPHSTAEYIQASSRVGRSEVPGVVVANYFRHQARSLSAYEMFRPFHESFYRFVEPASVTPFTYPVRARALHAALVIVIRHMRGGFAGNQACSRFDSEAGLTLKAVAALKERCAKAASEEEMRDLGSQLDDLVGQWAEEVRRCRKKRRNLAYHSRDNSADSLLTRHDRDARGLWPTLDSMRNVESTAVLKEAWK